MLKRAALGLLDLQLGLGKRTMRWMESQLDKQQRLFDAGPGFEPTDAPAWTSPNQILLEHRSLRLRAFFSDEESELSSPVTDETAPLDIPLLVVTPQVNNSYICDYAEGQSLVTTLHEQGMRRVAAIDWRSADKSRKDESLDQALQAVRDCIQHLGGKVHLVGLCQGGWMSTIIAALYPNEVASLTLAAAPIDFHAEPGGVNWMAKLLPMSFYNTLVHAGEGVIRGKFISMGFNNLRFVERNIGRYFTLYAKLDDERFMTRFQRMLTWYGQPQNIPGPAYLQIVKELFKENRLVQGRLTIHGRRVTLSALRAPVYLIAGERDHITRPGQLYAAADHVGSTVTRRYMADAGHIGVFMGSKALREVWPQVVADIQHDLSDADGLHLVDQAA